jgi:hypothetical protein
MYKTIVTFFLLPIEERDKIGIFDEVGFYMKNSVFWDVALCKSCVNRRFGGTDRLHLQGIQIRERGTSVSR